MTERLEKLIHAQWFQRAIMGTIVLAGILAGLETSAGLTERFGTLLRVLDSVVLGVFVVELALRLAAHGSRPWRFFKDGWNLFDFLIVLACCLPIGGEFTAVLRLARVLRVTRLVSAVPKLQLLVGALLKSLGAMGYVSLLLALLFYIYGVAGVHLFGRNDPVHFGSLPTALITLFRVITLENWGTIYDVQQYGAANFGYEGREHLIIESKAMPVAAAIYFVSFIMLGTMIVLNLFIGIIMNSMSEMHAEMEERERVRHIAQSGRTTLEDEINLLETQIESLKAHLVRIRHRIGTEQGRMAHEKGRDGCGSKGQPCGLDSHNDEITRCKYTVARG